MNCCNTADICLNGITMSTDEYFLGHFSLSGSGEYDLASRVNGVGVYLVVVGMEKDAIKKGTALMDKRIKQMNTVRGTSSVIGSTSAGALTSIKSFFKRLFR